MASNHKEIVNYYDTCETDYRRWWDLENSLAMHLGYWDDSTKNLSDALAKENEILAQFAEIKATDRVLDAGCGVGGSSIYLSNHIQCKVTGISLSEKQIQSAKQNAATRCQNNPPEFYQLDFTNTSLPDASFDVVWGLESVCHAFDKKAFIEEAYRLLKPNGRLIVADGFLDKNSLSKEENDSMRCWVNGWGVDHLASVTDFESLLQESGFKNIQLKDITVNVLPSSKKLYRLFLWAWPFYKIGEWLGIRTHKQNQNILGAYYQYKTLVNKLWIYGIFIAKK